MRCLTLALSLLLLGTAPALAHHVSGHQDHIWAAGYEGRGHGHSRSHADRNDNDTTSLVVDRNGNVRFSTKDLNIIIDWFKRDETRQTRVGSLPPGLARQLRERGHLPPGLAMKGLPPGLADRLGPAPDGYDRVIVGNDVVLINMATGVIADILRGVFRG